MGVVKLAVLLVVYTVIGALLLICVPGLPPDMTLEPYELPPPLILEGKLSRNGKLDNAELVFDGDYMGPESIAIRTDEVFTSVVGGHIVRVDKNGKSEKILQTGKPCAGPWEIEICGRPLGLRFDANGKLLVADATIGLLRVDIDKKTKETLIPRYGKIGNDLPLNFADDVDVTKEGLIFFSDAGQAGTYGDIFPDIIGQPTGRLIQYDPKTKKTEVLISGLRFANGVQLSRKEDFVAVCETGMARVWKHYLSGPKKGRSEILIEALPGYPDNIRSNGKGGFYVSLLTSRDAKNPGPLDTMAPVTWLRKLLLRLQRISIKALDLANSYAPNEMIGKATVYVKHFGPLGDITAFPRNVIIVEIDENGNVLGSLQNQIGKISYISEVDVGEQYTYLGSPYTTQLWRIKTANL